ncbi:hypothetical protein B566_EDAN018101 [Ephemera danica]|nr:hypothetical protein B566_EDAN018101 [Ephemera danica]
MYGIIVQLIYIFSQQPQNDLSNPYEKEKPKCILCQLNINPDYKNVRLLSQFVSPYTGRIYGRHITGLCNAKQKVVEEEIKKAQSCGIVEFNAGVAQLLGGGGLMATMLKDVAFLKDPKLYNPEKPIRPHRF